MYCSNCGEKIEDDWQLCPNCGQKIKEDPDLSKDQQADSPEENSPEKSGPEENGPEGNSPEGNPDQLGIFRKVQYWINMFLDIAIAVVFALYGRFLAAIILAVAGVIICPKLLNKVEWKKRTFIVSASIMLTAASVVVFVETPKEESEDNRIQVQDEQSDKKVTEKENKKTVPTEEVKTPEPETQEPAAEEQYSGSDEQALAFTDNWYQRYADFVSEDGKTLSLDELAGMDLLAVKLNGNSMAYTVQLNPYTRGSDGAYIYDMKLDGGKKIGELQYYPAQNNRVIFTTSDENLVFSPAGLSNSAGYSGGYEADYSWYVDHDIFSRGRMGDILEVVCQNDVRLEVEFVSTDGTRIGWTFNAEPDEIGGQGELIYYGDVVMIYYPKDHHIEIQTGDGRVAGSYYSI